MNIFLLISLSLLSIFSLNILRRKKYAFSLITISIISVVELLGGYLGTKLMFLIESGEWGGRSFFGAVLFLPLIFALASKILRIEYPLLTDLIAPSGLSMFAINKFNCYVAGCCGGRLLGFSPEGIPQRFPSQLVEMITAIAIVAILLLIEWKSCLKGMLYPIGLILYGTTRFLLNFYREEWAKYDGGLIPFGTIWSVLSVMIGIIWLIVLIIRKRNLTNNQT